MDLTLKTYWNIDNIIQNAAEGIHHGTDFDDWEIMRISRGALAYWPSDSIIQKRSRVGNITEPISTTGGPIRIFFGSPRKDLLPGKPSRGSEIYPGWDLDNQTALEMRSYHLDSYSFQTSERVTGFRNRLKMKRLIPLLAHYRRKDMISKHHGWGSILRNHLWGTR